jgi:hypothetical protein
VMATSKREIKYFFTTSVLITEQSMASSRVKINLQFFRECHAGPVSPTASYTGIVLNS